MLKQWARARRSWKSAAALWNQPYEEPGRTSLPYFEKRFANNNPRALWECLDRYRTEIASLPRSLSFNGFFGPADVAFYYCIIREAKPKNILEIGSGYSTRVATLAAKRNGSGIITCIDPEPRIDLSSLDVRHIAKRVELVGDDPFSVLDSGDVLFIDSSHTSQEARCHQSFLSKLPSGVNVHYHDIDYPWTRPSPDWDEDQVIHDFIQDRAWKVRIFGSVLSRDHREEMLSAIPRYRKTPYRRYNALWLQST
jgi:predicted O-methyltransferase YrrM